MTKREFAEEVAKIVGGQVTNVEKANGIVLTGVIVGDGAIRPTVYLDQMYDEGRDIEECAVIVRELAERSNITIPDLSRIYDFDSIKGDLRMRMYNKATHAEIYKSASDYGFDDMILVPYLDNVIPNGSIKISASFLDIWGVTVDELFEAASSAGDYEILSLHSVLAELAQRSGKDFPAEENCPMLIVTNAHRCYGAYGVIALSERFREIFPSGYTVIPSSVHECIVIPKESADIEIINSMVQEVNAGCVCPEEILGSRAYEF